ncbi:hypothetical protein MRB53_040974 [Persea americana]|nr:hypothetical protein MRB53_040974 [Persea americana]
MEENGETVSGDFMNLMKSTRSAFVSALFGQEALQTIAHPQERTAILQASLSSKPTRQPSLIRKRGERPARFASLRQNRPAVQEEVVEDAVPAVPRITRTEKEQ